MRWPGCDVVADIARVTKGLTGVGGSPCQGILRLNADRVHLQDPRSKFFYKYVEVLGWIEDVAREMRVWCVKMVENAVGDDEGIKEMSQQLGCRPCICARVAKKGAPQPARAEGNPEELGVTSPFSCFPLMPFPSPVTFADLSGCFVKRSKQLKPAL